MKSRVSKWMSQIEQLKKMELSNTNGMGDTTKIKNFLDSLPIQDLWELEVFFYIGEYGIDNIEEIVDKKIEELGKEPKQDVIDNICSKSRNLKSRMEGAEIIISGK